MAHIRISPTVRRTLTAVLAWALCGVPAAVASPGGLQPLPGAPPMSPALQKRLRTALAAEGAGNVSRTRYRNADGSPKYTNRLILESSPYLQQHAHNPVNWYPWGDEAFEAAKRLKRPVLLSVGYSTCHWCHVMEEESFENEKIARYLNEHYIAIEVDREERPDIDAVYMSAVEALTGSGGWPMTVWLTPEREPFFGGSYFPPRDGERGVRLGFLTLLQKLAAIYAAKPDRVAESAAQLTKAIRTNLASSFRGDRLPGAAVMKAAAAAARRRFDAANGGTRGAPKFPNDLPVRFLLRFYRWTGDPQALSMAIRTLEKMAAGGIYDQVGGGFHRYSTDAQWLVPHFEKMLYTNALLVIAYLEGYQASGREDLARVARGTLRYVERDMTSPDGAFYSASDADSLPFKPRGAGGHSDSSAGEKEGLFYTWTPSEVEAAVGEERAPIVEAYFGITANGEVGGRSVLHIARSPEQVAHELKLPVAKVRREVAEAVPLLRAARRRRPAPARDDKILAAWNGLMISAYARAALVLGDAHDARMASRAASFVLSKMRRRGRLLRSYRDGRAEQQGYLDDYAFLIQGLLDLYEATGELQWLNRAIELDAELAAHYEDRKNGGFFFTADDGEALLVREKPGFDGTEPSGNSIEALNLLRLYELTTDERYRVRADRTIEAFGRILARTPLAMSDMLLAVDWNLDAAKEIVIVCPRSRQDAAPFLAVLAHTFVPNRVLSVVVEGDDLSAAAKVIPLVAEKIARGKKATAYVCERQVCQLPTTSPKVFARQIGAGKRTED